MPSPADFFMLGVISMSPVRQRLRQWLIYAKERGEVSERVGGLIWLLSIEVDDVAVESFLKGLE